MVAGVGSMAALGCDPGGVGDPCIPEDEYRQQVPGYAVTEVNVESRSFQCETRVCLVNHFQGRVSCPYGQTETQAAACENQAAACTSATGLGCRVPGTNGENTNDRIKVAVAPQLLARTADDAVYCSCRCDGPDENARYCECPSGYACVELVEDLQLGAGQLAGSYCIKEGTRYSTAQREGDKCVQQLQDPTNPLSNVVGGNCGNDGKNP
jgi:hypothetical protein